MRGATVKDQLEAMFEFEKFKKKETREELLEMLNDMTFKEAGNIIDAYIDYAEKERELLGEQIKQMKEYLEKREGKLNRMFRLAGLMIEYD